MVVTSAISTIIVNSVGEMTPRSRPTLSTMSSISPRVFISTPSAGRVAPAEPGQPRGDERAAELADRRDER